jgi:hypothetical protein
MLYQAWKMHRPVASAIPSPTKRGGLDYTLFVKFMAKNAG